MTRLDFVSNFMINRHHCYYICRMEMIQGWGRGARVWYWRTWTPQRPVWPVFVVSHWTGSSFFDLLHGSPRLSYANAGQTRGGNVLELSRGGQRLPLSFSASFPHLYLHFSCLFPSQQLDRLWHERKWVLSGWERWGWCCCCDLHHLWGTSALKRSLVMCMWSVILSGPCSVYCRSVIVWAVLPVIAQFLEEWFVAFPVKLLKLSYRVCIFPCLSQLCQLYLLTTSKVLSLSG